MKEITMFYLESCPHCKKARNFMQKLWDQHPEYAKLPVKMIEESKEKELADSYDYFYVPCYYVDGVKVAEGSIDEAGVKKVFDQAMES